MENLNKCQTSKALLTEKKITNNHETSGRHFILELSGCKAELLTDVTYIEKVLKEAVLQAKATIINSCFYRFKPTGVSGIILLSESHCSIHTWPEERYAAVDIYTCGKATYPEEACRYLSEALDPEHTFISFLERGHKANNSLRFKHSFYNFH